LIQKGIAKEAVAQLELLVRVAQHKSLFFKSSWVNYGAAARGTLRIAPPSFASEKLSLRDEIWELS